MASANGDPNKIQILLAIETLKMIDSIVDWLSHSVPACHRGSGGGEEEAA